MALGHAEEPADPRLTTLVNEDKIPWYKKPNLRYLYFVLVPCGLGVEMTSGYDSSMMNGLQGVPAWDVYFAHPTGSRLGLFNAIYSLGALMCIPFVPFVSSRLGRRYTIVMASLIMILGASLQGAASSFNMFLASRWLIGFGVPFAIINASSLIGELCYPKERHIMTSLFNATWFTGSIIAAGTTYATFQMKSNWAWRIPSIVQAAPSLMNILFMPLCPESPRWLISKDRAEEAYAILARYHAEGDHASEFVKLEFAQIQSTIALEKELARSFSWADTFRDRAMRKRFFLAGATGWFTQWSGNGLLSFYMKKILFLIGITDPLMVQRIILTNTCWGLINGLPIALIVPRFPRRRMFLTCTCGMAVIYTIWTVCSARREITGSNQWGIAVLVFIYLYSPVYNIGWNALTYTYMVEIFPFSQRAQGIAFEQLSVRLAVFFNTYVNPIALDAIKWKYYIFYCCWIVVEIATVYFFYPETMGRTLEELSFMFEGREAQEKVERGIDKRLDAVHGEEREVGEERVAGEPAQTAAVEKREDVAETREEAAAAAAEEKK